MTDGAATAHTLLPKLVTILREGYNLDTLRKDAFAGLTVAVVALPLSMAIAVASGVSPERGLYTAIIGGFLVSFLGGSRFQIGGPAGAFIVLVAATVAKFGMQGLMVTVLLSGLMLGALGLMRLGQLVRFVPHAVTVGFTGGIAVTILASQLKDLAGLSLTSAEPGRLVEKLTALAGAVSSFNPAAFATGLGVATLTFALRRFRPSWPGMLIAVVLASVVVFLLHLPVETVGSRFGTISGGVPAPHAPQISPGVVLRMLPLALTFTLLGAVESLLSAKVADGMTGRRHRYNMELIAQGVANVASALFGGLSVTGTIARTATNIRAGARTPLAGMLHAAALLLFVLFAAPVVSFVPLSALAGVLIVVSWNMVEKAEFIRALRDWRTGSVLAVTFAFTALHDVSAGFVAGCLLASVLSAFHRGIPHEEL